MIIPRVNYVHVPLLKKNLSKVSTITLGLPVLGLVDTAHVIRRLVELLTRPVSRCSLATPKHRKEQKQKSDSGGRPFISSYVVFFRKTRGFGYRHNRSRGTARRRSVNEVVAGHSQLWIDNPHGMPRCRAKEDIMCVYAHSTPTVWYN